MQPPVKTVPGGPIRRVAVLAAGLVLNFLAVPAAVAGDAMPVAQQNAQEGEMQLAWAPLPKTGTLSAVVDGKTPVTYTVEGQEKMGNGNQGTTGPAAIVLY